MTFVLAQHVEIRIKKIRKYGRPEPHGSTRNCISIRTVQLGPDSAEVVFQVNKLGCQVLSSLGWRIGDKLAPRCVERVKYHIDKSLCITIHVVLEKCRITT